MSFTAKQKIGHQTERERAWSLEMAAYFREKRIAAGISIVDIATALNPSNPTEIAEHLRSCENGTSELSLDEVFMLTNAMNVPPEEVIAIFDKNFSLVD